MMTTTGIRPLSTHIYRLPFASPQTPINKGCMHYSVGFTAACVLAIIGYVFAIWLPFNFWVLAKRDPTHFTQNNHQNILCWEGYLTVIRWSKTSFSYRLKAENDRKFFTVSDSVCQSATDCTTYHVHLMSVQTEDGDKEQFATCQLPAAFTP